MVPNKIKINISILTSQSYQVVYCWFIMDVPPFPLTLCIIQLSIATSAKRKQMSKMPLGNVNIQHFNRKWKLSKYWKLAFAMTSGANEKMIWTVVGKVEDCQMVHKNVGFETNPVPVLCFYIKDKGKVPVGMNPLKIDVDHFEDNALKGPMAVVAQTGSSGKIGSKWCMFLFCVSVVGCFGVWHIWIHYLCVLIVLLHNYLDPNIKHKLRNSKSKHIYREPCYLLWEMRMGRGLFINSFQTNCTPMRE